MKTGRYRFSNYDYRDCVVRWYTVRVEIVGEGPKSYQIRLLQPIDNARPVGALMRVRKKSVVPSSASPPVTCREVESRLPYKD